jgi:cell division protein FtsL
MQKAIFPYAMFHKRRHMRDLTLAINQQTISRKKHSNPAAILRWNLAILTCIMILGLGYLIQINTLGTRGYAIKNLEQKIKQLELEHKQLEVQSSGLKSITRIQQEAENRNFVPATGVNYLQDGDFALR